MDLNKINEKVVSHGVRIDILEEKMSSLEVIKDAVTEINVTLKHLQKNEEKRDKLYEGQAKSLQKQADSLTKLTYVVNRLTEKVDSNDKEIKEANTKIEKLDKKMDVERIEEVKDSSISWNTIWKGGIMAGVTVVVGYLLAKVGIKK